MLIIQVYCNFTYLQASNYADTSLDDCILINIRPIKIKIILSTKFLVKIWTIKNYLYCRYVLHITVNNMVDLTIQIHIINW